jgi:hypothetical protein
VNDDYRYGPVDRDAPLDDITNPMPYWRVTGNLRYEGGTVKGNGTLTQYVPFPGQTAFARLEDYRRIDVEIVEEA